MRNKTIWSISLIILIVLVLAFGMVMSTFASTPTTKDVYPVSLTEFDWEAGLGAADPSRAWLISQYGDPDCVLRAVKINDPVTGTWDEQTGQIVWVPDVPTGFEVDLVIEDNTFSFNANMPVFFVWVKAGPNGNLYPYYNEEGTPHFPEGVFDDEGLYSPAADSISHITFYYCEPVEFEELTVNKTAVTSYTRTHEWDIEKKVETEEGFMVGEDTPKIWLYIDGSGDEKATWTIDVTYEGYEDDDFNVSGVITIENTGTLDAVITGITDLLGGTEVDLEPEITFPYTLPVGETLQLTYDEDGYVEGSNEVTVTTEEDQYFADAAIVWGDPDTEINETVNIKDVSDLFGEVDLGTVTAPNDSQFTYEKDFAWADYGAGATRGYTYENTATIVETEQWSKAILKVNVQGYLYETAYAKGDDAVSFIPYFRNWGWTNPVVPGTFEMDLWAGAAQSDTSKGTLVGSVTVVYGNDGYVTVTYNVDSPYSLEETHVYAGYDMFPQQRRGRRTVDTVAPGQYYNAGPFDGSQVYVIAHGVVGLPDPDFGPGE